MTSKLKVYAVSLDCPDPETLAAFYAELLGWKVEYTSDEGAGVKGDGDLWLFFQKVEDFRPAQWPGQDHPQQFHLDIAVPPAAIAESEQRAESLGAVRASEQPGGERWTVFIDPVGHPFCIFKEPSE